MRLFVVCAVVAVLAVVAAVGCEEAAAARVSLNFNYAWRFSFGHAPDGHEGPAPCGFSSITTTKPITCTGMNENPNRFSGKDCAFACCYNPDCRVFVHHKKSCAHGGADASCVEDPSGTVYDAAGTRATVPPIQSQYQYAEPGFNDSAWQIVDAPHDALAAASVFSPDADMHHAYIVRNVSWYRKHFHLPASFEGTHVYLHFEGIFHYAQVWVNGVYAAVHTAGYTGFTVRLDNITGIAFGQHADNVIAIRADATYGSGHWYEGGGIYRPVHLVSTPVTGSIVHNGVFVSPEYTPGTNPIVSAEVESFAELANNANVTFTLVDVSSRAPVSSVSASVSLQPGVPKLVTAQLSIPASAPIVLWSLQDPRMYNLSVTVTSPLAGSDTVSVMTGFRTTRWSGATGFYLNGNPVKFRGFSHHNSFAGVGVAVPERLYLYRVQSSRALGSNIWRMSHNPYLESVYHMLDNLGVMLWDENRDYGLEYVQEMHDMVKRDRNHPGIVVWGFCNEVECNQATNATGLAFRAAAKSLDKDRPTAANDFTYGIDVQGWSHAGAERFIKSHEKNPTQPLVLSECCSCISQRGDNDRDIGTCEHDQNAPGTLPYVTGSLGVWTLMDYFGEPPSTWPYVSSSYGQFDLAGMPKPHAYFYHVNWLALVNATSAGRPALLPNLKAARIVSLPGKISQNSAGNMTIHTITSSPQSELLVDGVSYGTNSTSAGVDVAWEVPIQTPASCGCDLPINASVQCRGLQLATAAKTPLECKTACCKDATCSIWQFGKDGEGKSQADQCWIGAYNPSRCWDKAHAHWVGEATSSRSCPLFTNVTILGKTGGVVDAAHTILSPSGDPTKYELKMFLDAPSVATATGSALVLDGRDAALVRTGVFDTVNEGALAIAPVVNITYTVVSGPGRILGTGNGDPASHQLPREGTKETFGGYTSAVVQVTWDCLSAHRDLLQAVDVDGGRRTSFPDNCTGAAQQVIVVKAEVTTADSPLTGLSSSISIPLSINPADAPVAFSRAPEALNPPSYSHLADFVG